jgi:hypothetical protein
MLNVQADDRDTALHSLFSHPHPENEPENAPLNRNYTQTQTQFNTQSLRLHPRVTFYEGLPLTPLPLEPCPLSLGPVTFGP